MDKDSNNAREVRLAGNGVPLVSIARELVDMGTAERNLSSLPAECYAVEASRPAGQRIVLIRAGETKRSQTTLDAPDLDVEGARKVVERLNRQLGVSREQSLAMMCGSVFGWDVPGADPETWKRLGGDDAR